MPGAMTGSKTARTSSTFLLFILCIKFNIHPIYPFVYQLQQREDVHNNRRLSFVSPKQTSTLLRQQQLSENNNDGLLPLSIQKALDILYPPTALDRRNALSRTDGYWKFISKNEEPPLEYTYGEFDLDFFAKILRRLEDISGQSWNDNKVFCDIGAGTGRLVLAAASLYSWKECRGIEILEQIYGHSKEILQSCKLDNGEYRLPAAMDGDELILLSPINLIEGSFTDPYLYLGDIDVFFVFSSCMSPDILRSLSQALGRQGRPGAYIVTTDYPLFLNGTIPPYENDDAIPHGYYELDLMEMMDGSCEVTGGTSTAYIHRVKQSLYDGIPRKRKTVSLEEQAYSLVQSLEQGELTDSEKFLRGVYNDMIFHGMPEEWSRDLLD